MAHQSGRFGSPRRGAAGSLGRASMAPSSRFSRGTASARPGALPCFGRTIPSASSALDVMINLLGWRDVIGRTWRVARARDPPAAQRAIEVHEAGHARQLRRRQLELDAVETGLRREYGEIAGDTRLELELRQV